MLSPRAVVQLHDLGLADALAAVHRVDGVRLVRGSRTRDLDWPSHPDAPPTGYVVRRRQFDEVLARRAEAAGAILLEEHEAVEPIVERGFVRGAVVRSPVGTVRIAATYVVVADGANSRFGRAVGTFRRPTWPFAVGVRSYWATPRHADRAIEVSLGLEDRNGASLPGYGWVFPLGDGTANVGIGLWSSAREFRSINPSHLLDAHLAQVAERWGIDPGDPLDAPSTGRIPMGGSVGPTAGPTFLVAGDAAAVANAFDGEGIGPALETGRIAADVLHDALTTGDATALQRYPRAIDDRFGDHHAAARVLARATARPTVMRELAAAAVRSKRVGGSFLRIATDLLRPDHRGTAEAALRLAVTAARLSPDA